jgi:hypothetical protein
MGIPHEAPWAAGPQLKFRNISRKDAKTQRLEEKKFFSAFTRFRCVHDDQRIK